MTSQQFSQLVPEEEYRSNLISTVYGKRSLSPAFVFQTSAPPTGIPTNFANGDFVLFTGADFRSFPATGNSSPVTINFNTPVQSAGTQITVDDTFNFDGSIQIL